MPFFIKYTKKTTFFVPQMEFCTIFRLSVRLFVCLSHFSKNSNQLGPSFSSQITSQARNQLLFLRKPIAGCDLKTQKTRFLVTADRTSAIKFQLKSWINNIKIECLSSGTLLLIRPIDVLDLKSILARSCGSPCAFFFW